MKKFASLAIVALLILELFIPSFAADTKTEVSAEGSASMEISTTATAEYTLSFPADMTIPWESEEYAIGAVTAEKMLIAPDKVVRVEVMSQNDFKLIHETDKTQSIAYTLLTQDTANTQLEFGPGTVGKSVPLSVQITPDAWAQAASGKHNDRLTFVVSYI